MKQWAPTCFPWDVVSMSVQFQIASMRPEWQATPIVRSVVEAFGMLFGVEFMHEYLKNKWKSSYKSLGHCFLSSLLSVGSLLFLTLRVPLTGPLYKKLSFPYYHALLKACLPPEPSGERVEREYKAMGILTMLVRP